jgi:hypothetical protein
MAFCSCIFFANLTLGRDLSVTFVEIQDTIYFQLMVNLGLFTDLGRPFFYF